MNIDEATDYVLEPVKLQHETAIGAKDNIIASLLAEIKDLNMEIAELHSQVHMLCGRLVDEQSAREEAERELDVTLNELEREGY